MSSRPNILLILNDDMGYSDIGCYGGEVDTPNLDALATGGVRLTQFYNTARCSPSRASLLTGLHPHQVGVGVLTNYDGPEGYEGELQKNGVTIAETLKTAGYGTYMTGKWHLTRNEYLYDKTRHSWPINRGFDHHFGTLCGAGNFYSPKTLQEDGELLEEAAYNDPDFYYTDAISDKAAEYIDRHFAETPEKPFFQYVAYTAPHWPLHAPEAVIEKYKGRFAEGWDVLREKRLRRLVEAGILDESWLLSPRDPGVCPWEEAENKEWRQRRMEVYAAQIDVMDQGIGRIIDALKRNDQLENTLVIFLADNGGCAEEIMANSDWAKSMKTAVSGGYAHTAAGNEITYGNDPGIIPGDETTYQSYGTEWANLSNTPFRMYKHWIHEGGVATPFIVHWPAGVEAKNEIRHQPAQLTDVMATVLEVSGAEYPEEFDGRKIEPLEGSSLTPIFRNEDRDVTLFFEHEGNAAVRKGKWKLVKNFTGVASAKPDYEGPNGPRDTWELYDMDADRTELHDVASEHPELVAEMAAEYDAWAKRCGVIPRDDFLAAREAWNNREKK